MWKINYSKWYMQGEPNSIPLILVIKSDSYNLLGVIPTYTKVKFGIGKLNQRGVWNARVFMLNAVYTLVYQGKQFWCHMSSYQSPPVLFIPYNILWIPEIHHAIYSMRYLITTQLLFVTFKCRGVILRQTDSKLCSFFIEIVRGTWTKAGGAARPPGCGFPRRLAALGGCTLPHAPVVVSLAASRGSSDVAQIENLIVVSQRPWQLPQIMLICYEGP